MERMTQFAQPTALTRLTAADVMTTEVVRISEHDSVAAAWELLSRGEFHHLPVVRGRRFVGMLDDRLLIRAMDPGTVTRRRRVAELLPATVVSVPPDLGIVDVARRMGASGRDAVAVVDGDELLGVLTSVDLVAVLASLA